MTHKGILGLVFVVVLGASCIAFGTDGSTLVFKDGSSIEVASLTLERGSVVVELADGRKQQFDKRDIDLEASGLTRSAPRATASSPPPKTARKLVMPGDETDATGLTITDRDVRHVRPSSGRASEYEDESEDQKDAPGIIPLRISGVRQTEHDGGVTVTGTVTNDGVFDLEKTTVTGYAVDADGNNLGQGSVGLASLLTQGASRNFSLMIPVTGDVDAVRVSASAAEIRPAPPGSEAPDRPQDTEDEFSESQPSEDEASAAGAG